MAYNKQYKDFLEISPNFESVVDIDADKRNQNLWRGCSVPVAWQRGSGCPEIVLGAWFLWHR